MRTFIFGNNIVNGVKDKTSCFINKQKEKSNTADLTISRAYFRKIKHPGIDASLKKFFLKNKAGLLLKQRTLFQEQFDSIPHFK